MINYNALSIEGRCAVFSSCLFLSVERLQQSIIFCDYEALPACRNVISSSWSPHTIVWIPSVMLSSELAGEIAKNMYFTPELECNMKNFNCVLEVLKTHPPRTGTSHGDLWLRSWIPPLPELELLMDNRVAVWRPRCISQGYSFVLPSEYNCTYILYRRNTANFTVVFCWVNEGENVRECITVH